MIKTNFELKSRSTRSANVQKVRNELAINEGLLPIKCKLCQFESMYSILKHIVCKHDISIDEYKRCFGEEKLQQIRPTQRKKIRDCVKIVMNKSDVRAKVLAGRSFPSEVKHWTKKGFLLEEAQEKVREFQRIQSLKGNNDITRVKRSKRFSGHANPMSLESISNRNNVTIDIAKQLTPCFGRTGEKHPMFGKHHTQDALEKIASSPQFSNPKFRSIPEIQIATFCESLGELKTNVKISRWNVDVLFSSKKLIVEFFGDWWHMNPAKFEKCSEHKVMKKSAGDIWMRDERKLSELSALGYEVIVIWESDWKNDKNNCAERIKNAFDRIL
jgi:G:T-mismatch repair DNA endonuclease (very short patch repair protein)